MSVGPLLLLLSAGADANIVAQWTALYDAHTEIALSYAWEYDPSELHDSLKSATRILNMVPTKKVDKTPYELWYGKVPNLSYLRSGDCEALVKRE
ncbi:hypothetical protein Tco_0526941 [Tanacetum coccineum]